MIRMDKDDKVGTSTAEGEVWRRTTNEDGTQRFALILDEMTMESYKRLMDALARAAIPLRRLRLYWRLERRMPKRVASLVSRLCPRWWLPKLGG